MMSASNIQIVEVGPRDGLQNESRNIPTELKIRFIDALSNTGLTCIEATSFVSPKWVPQMADHSEVMQGILRKPGVQYGALVPNEYGMKEALAADVKQIAIFIAASETFSQHNINCSIAESLQRAQVIMDAAKQHHILVRGYISCVLGCPYEGNVDLATVTQLTEQLIEMGCYQVSLGDTIGVGTANQAKKLIQTVEQSVALDKIAVHFHDTYAQALANIYQSLELGITTIDSAVGGLGGCPYAPGAGGNVASEDVVYLLNGLGVNPGIDLAKLAAAGRMITGALEIHPRSKVSIALAAANTRK